MLLLPSVSLLAHLLLSCPASLLEIDIFWLIVFQETSFQATFSHKSHQVFASCRKCFDVRQWWVFSYIFIFVVLSEAHKLLCQFILGKDCCNVELKVFLNCSRADLLCRWINRQTSLIINYIIIIIIILDFQLFNQAKSSCFSLLFFISWTKRYIWRALRGAFLQLFDISYTKQLFITVNSSPILEHIRTCLNVPLKTSPVHDSPFSFYLISPPNGKNDTCYHQQNQNWSWSRSNHWAWWWHNLCNNMSVILSRKIRAKAALQNHLTPHLLLFSLSRSAFSKQCNTINTLSPLCSRQSYNTNLVVSSWYLNTHS